ncbi:MAG: hypothetical protein HC933_03090 [Pleurocapsa sp. SU_196_0]|nr:hypothetical protein [Pleurocapsa sp. SU_196_0]
MNRSAWISGILGVIIGAVLTFVAVTGSSTETYLKLARETKARQQAEANENLVVIQNKTLSAEAKRLNEQYDVLFAKYNTLKAKSGIVDGYTLKLEYFNCENAYGYGVIKGRVKNIGETTLSFIKVSGEFLNKSNQVIQSSDSYIKTYQTLAPGDSSMFEVQERVSDYAKCQVTFFDENGTLNTLYPKQ